jgi:VWFA-related protein
VAAIIDRSFSMRGARFAAAKAGALRFVDELAPEDRLEVASVGSDVTRIAMPGESRERAEAAIRTLEIWGTTPLGDAVAQAIRVVQPWSGRRAVVLFTDGEDRSNDTERGAALAAAQTSGVLVYAVAVGGGKATLLGDLAGSSGGLVISATNPSTAAAAGATLARDLRRQYLVGFTPTDRAPGWHRLTVGVDVPGAAVRARKGYFTPGPSASRP